MDESVTTVVLSGGGRFNGGVPRASPLARVLTAVMFTALVVLAVAVIVPLALIGLAMVILIGATMLLVHGLGAAARRTKRALRSDGHGRRNVRVVRRDDAL